MAPEAYHGAISLGASKYASPMRKANFATFPSAAPSSAKPKVSGTIATMEQIAAIANGADTSTEVAPYNADAQLAITQNEALKEEVSKHSESFTKSVSSAVTNTRQLLSLLRESIKKDKSSSETELRTVDDLWNELERLFEATKEAKSALPKFMEKQKENMSLYHSSMMNETLGDTQEELKLQHKKVNIQHSLILEHQQAFQEYKSKSEEKLHDLSDSQERVSRLTLDKGLLKTEINNFAQQLTEERERNVANLKAASQLRKELETVRSSKKELAAENETLRNAISELQEKLKTAQLSITDYESEHRKLKDALSKGTQKVASVDTMVKALQAGGDNIKKEAEQLKVEYEKLQVKFKNQGAEYSKVFAQFTEQSKKISALTSDLESVRAENGSLKELQGKLDQLKKTNADLLISKDASKDEVKDLKCQVGDFEEQMSRTSAELKAISEKVKKMEKENDELEMENNDLLAKATENKKLISTMAALMEENSKLQASVQELQMKTKVPASTPTPMSIDNEVLKSLEDRLQESEEDKSKLRATMDEWQKLAKRSYEEYKTILPTYKQAEQYRQAVESKDAELKQLKQALQGRKGPEQTNNTVTGGDGAYWKDKYESLLVSLDN